MERDITLSFQAGRDHLKNIRRSTLNLLLAIIPSSLALLFCSHLMAQQPQQTTAQNPPATIRSYVNEVLVPVVVRDAQGNAVGNLKKDDFQVFDDGKPQALTGFMIVKRSNETIIAESATPNPLPNASPLSTQAASPAQRFVVFLFDDLNLNTSDLMQAQRAATKLLDNSLPSTDTAAVLSTSGSNSGLTRDHAKLQKAISDLRVSNLYRHVGHDCPDVDYYQGDQIVNKNDPMALRAATEDALTCAQLDPSMIDAAERMARQAAQRATAIGEQNYRVALNFMRTVVGKMEGLPGQRVLILISPGFLTPTGEAMTLKSQLLDIAAQSNVVISAIDARGLYTMNMDASEQGGGSPMSTQLHSQYRQASMTSSEDVMAELADGTGGTFFHNNNNLEVGLSSLFSGPAYLYLLTFSTANVKPNGSYHTLKVKVNQPGLKLQGRHGYIAPAPEKKKK